MKSLTQKSAKQVVGAGVRVVTLALFLVVFGAGAALAQTRGYVANGIAQSVSVIDPATNTIVATITLGATPNAIAVTPNGNFAYTANANNTVSVISAATNSVVTTVAVGASPTGIAITPNGAFAYVANSGANSVSVINTATDTVTATIPGVANPSQIAISASGDFVYVTGNDGDLAGFVTKIDTATNMVAATVLLPDSPGLAGIAITPNGARAYVTNANGFDVFVIDTATNTLFTTVTVGSFPRRVDITPNGAFAYVCNGNDTVSVINTATNTVDNTVAVAPFSLGLAIDPTGTSVYTTSTNFVSSITVISTASNTVTTTFSSGPGTGPVAIAFGVRTNGPTNKDQCKNGGWATFTNPTFKNQGQCIKFVNHMNE
ncbi:MAG TPA: beta-propeller fold lactonase family protein [Pyrinomonadaceae bacterium]|nr:beta-propeller fold lactonase family protein [Pyrinomonadaceae bacterium]